MATKAKPTKLYIETKEALPKELQPIFDQLLEEYKFASFKHHGQGFASPKVIAELVLMGWRSPPIDAPKAARDGK